MFSPKPCALWGSLAGVTNALLGVAAGDSPSIVITLSTVVALLAGGLVWVLRYVLAQQGARLDRIERLLAQKSSPNDQSTEKARVDWNP